MIDLGLSQLYAMDQFTRVQQEAFATTETRGGNPRPLGVSTTWNASDGRTWSVAIWFDRSTQAYWFLDVTSGYLHGFDSGYHATEIPTLLWTGQLAPLPPEALEAIADAVVRKMVKLVNLLTAIRFASREAGLSFKLLDMVPFEAVMEVDGGRRRVQVLADTEELVEGPI